MIEREEEEESLGAGLEPGCGTNELDTVTEVTEGALVVDGCGNSGKGDEGEGDGDVGKSTKSSGHGVVGVDGVDMVMVVVVAGSDMERGRR